MQIAAIIRGVVADFKRFFWPHSNIQKIVRLGVVALVLLFAIRWLGGSEAPVEDTPVAANTVVSLVTPLDVAVTQSGSYIGTVRAVSEAQIQSEVAGRVTSVRVRPGDQVAAGTIIATLENSAQSAAVLQAEGAYESALAAAAQSTVSVSTAETNLQTARESARTTYQSAYTTVNDVVVRTLDQFFRNPQSGIPTLQIATDNNQVVTQLRSSLNRSLEDWQQASVTIAPTDDVAAALNSERQTIEEVLQITDEIIEALEGRDLTDTFNGQAVSTYLQELSTARSSLVSTLNSFESAVSGITAAEDALAQAEIAGSGTEVSAADAQVKSALGSLRAAQAQLAKTILRTPIAGTVNEVQVNTGDFIASFTQVAEVANNGGLEVAFFVTEAEAAALTVNQALTVGNSGTGTIVSIAPAVSQTTQKTEVRAAVSGEELVNGSTIRVTPVLTADTEAANQADMPIRLPITAVRFTATDGFVFVVVNEILVSQPVVLGSISGSAVEIIEGINSTTAVVGDARGLAIGQRVTVVSN